MDPHAKMERDALKHVPDLAATLSRQPLSYFNKTASELFDTLHKPLDQPLATKLTRDDRQSKIGIDIAAEEKTRAVPVRSSGAYGARPPLESPDATHGRRAVVQEQFYTSSGVKLE